MRRKSLVAGFIALITCAALLLALSGDPRPPETEPGSPLVPETPYVVRVDHERADVDLSFTPDTRYVLVVSSLSRGMGAYRVTGSARAAQSLRFTPRQLPVSTPESAIAKPAVAIGASNSTSSQNLTAAAASPAAAVGRPEAARSFALHVTDGSLDDASQYATVAAHQVASGQSVRVFLDNQQAAKTLAPGLIQSIAELFDGDLIPNFRQVFGASRKVNEDGRFVVLLSPWLARLQGGRTSVGGFVRGSDFQSRVAAPFGNRCEMMYVNSQTIPGPHLRTLLIHEYTHALCFSHRIGERTGMARFPDEEDWLNEGLAHCAESLFNGGWSNLDYRISRYLNDTAAYPLVVEDYYRAGLWRCHGCRGATYLFLRYCVERFGTQTLTRLIDTPARGFHNLELATGVPFDRLFRDWTLSLIQPQTHSSVTPTLDVSDRRANSSGNCGRLANLDLYGALGPWGLAGPRRTQWEIDGQPLRLDLKGTSTAFLEMRANCSAGPRRIHFEAARGAQMQISLVRLPDEQPRIDVAASLALASSSANSPTPPSSAPRVLRAVVRLVHGNGLAIEQIAAEQNSDESRRPLRFAGANLRSMEVAASDSEKGNSDKATRDKNATEKPCRVFDLPAEQFSQVDCPVIVKVVAVDRSGRRITAWTTVTPQSTQQVATLAGQRH